MFNLLGSLHFACTSNNTGFGIASGINFIVANQRRACILNGYWQTKALIQKPDRRVPIKLTRDATPKPVLLDVYAECRERSKL